MPKRIPTPPPAEDEPRYLTVVHPYAISGSCNMELAKDREDFARWVACCVDKDAFLSLFHKPSSRDMVIIEVDRYFDHFDRILGEHRWSEFLRDPTKEESGRVTQVFFCAYNTGRYVQKNGWKRIDVNDAWFKTWSPKNRQIMFPYPPTHFCDVPNEDQTNHPLCRPLPNAMIIPPVEVAAPQPVVGSAEWIQKRGGNQGKSNAWGKGAPKVPVKSNSAPASGAPKKTAGIPQGPPAVIKKQAVGGGPIAVKSSNVWQNTGKKPASVPSVIENWEESPPASRQGTPVSPGQPGLPTQKNAWGSDASSCPTHPLGVANPAACETQNASDRTANFSADSWGSGGGVSTSSPDTDWGPDAIECDNPYAVRVRYSEFMEEEFHGMGIKAIEDEEGLKELDAIAPGTWDDPAAGATWDTVNAGSWEGDEPGDWEDLWKKKNEELEQEPKQILCNAHGSICKKGICVEYSRQLRQANREEEAKTAVTNKGKKGGGRSKARGWARNNDGDESTDRNKAGRDNNNQFRGPGAPVKKNWRGAPRAIVDADAVEKQETAKAFSDGGWGNSEAGEPNIAEVVSPAEDATSNAGWTMSESDFDPWATKDATVATKVTQDKKNQNGTPSWADQVDAELGNVISSKRGGGGGSKPKRGGSKPKRGGSSSATSWGTTSDARSSTSGGWGNVTKQDMPW